MKSDRQTNVNPKQIPNTPLVYDTTKVSYSKSLFSGRRKVIGIRIDENLYLAFKPIAKRVFGSVCRPIESFMASVVALDQTGANFGNTIQVHEIKIERNLRTRRQLVVEEEVSIVEKVKPVYSKLPSAELRRLLGIAEREHKVVDRQLIAFELNRRDVKVLGAT